MKNLMVKFSSVYSLLSRLYETEVMEQAKFEQTLLRLFLGANDGYRS